MLLACACPQWSFWTGRHVPLSFVMVKCQVLCMGCPIEVGLTWSCLTSGSQIIFFLMSARPLLCLLDGHSSHYCPEMIRLAAAEQVIIFALPPNTTHLTQPLDKGCFGPLKVCWKEACQDYMKKNPGKVMSRYFFFPKFSVKPG